MIRLITLVVAALFASVVNAALWTIQPTVQNGIDGPGGQGTATQGMIFWFAQGVNGSSVYALHGDGTGPGYACFGLSAPVNLTCSSVPTPEIWDPTPVTYAGSVNDDLSFLNLGWVGEAGIAPVIGPTTPLFSNSVVSGGYDAAGNASGLFACWNNPSAVRTFGGADFCGNQTGGAVLNTGQPVQDISTRNLRNGLVDFRDNRNGTITIDLTDSSYSACVNDPGCNPDATTVNVFVQWTLNASPSTGSDTGHLIAISGSQSSVDGACVAAIPATGGFDCSYDATDPIGAATPWSGPVIGSGYYASGNSPYDTGGIGNSPPTPDPNKVRVALFEGAPYSSNVRIDDGSGGAPECGSNDRVGALLSLSAATRWYQGGPGQNAEESWADGMVRIPIPLTRVTSALPNVPASGDCTYTVASLGFPPLLDVVQAAGGGKYPQDVAAMPGTYVAPSPVDVFCGSDELGFDGVAGNCGAVVGDRDPNQVSPGVEIGSGSFPPLLSEWQCQDNTNAATGPIQCGTAAPNPGACGFTSNHYCGARNELENVLISIVTDASGDIKSGIIYVQNESRIFNVGPPSPNANSWDGAVYEFVGNCTNCGPGPALIDVPDVTGLSQPVAMLAIVAAGLSVGDITTAFSESVAAGDVISQNPVACGECALPGDPVDLVISDGPEPIDVPDVTDQPQASAEAAIVSAGLSVGVVTNANSDSVSAGFVISQNPVACTACAFSGDPVDILVSLGPVPIPERIDQLADATAAAVSSKGLRNALIAKLNGAQASLARGNVNAAINELQAYINQVRAQSGKKIDAADAAALIAAAEEIITRL